MRRKTEKNPHLKSNNGLEANKKNTGKLHIIL